VAVVLVKPADMEALQAEVAAFEAMAIAEYAAVEDAISVKAAATAMPSSVMPCEVAK
jgi:hypothetical protein